MILFSTMLEINDTLTKDLFIQLILEWNQGSPHLDNVIKDIEWNGERNIRFVDKNLWLDIEEYRNENIIAARYERIGEDGIIWDTDFVMNFNTMQMSIRLDRGFGENALTTESSYSPPHFINLLIDKGYVKDDNDLPVLYSAMEIDESNIDILANIINGKKDYKMPVVFVSKTFYDENPVDMTLLTKQLRGMAHILIQQSNTTNNTLRKMCASQNEYYGAVGIYFPSPFKHRKYLYHQSIGTDPYLLGKIVRSIIQYQNAQHMDTLYTWDGVYIALTRDRLISAREKRIKAENDGKKALYELIELKGNLSQKEEEANKKAKEEADKIIEAFDEEQQDLQNEVDRLTNENERLQYENYGLKLSLDKINEDERPILHMGDEEELYPGEIHDIILSVLSEVKLDHHTQRRRADLVKDIIEHNDYEEISDQKADEVKRLLKNYSKMTSKLHQSLEKLGFEITEEGKHYKINYYGDERYQFTLAKTPSDFREGENVYHQINNMVF